MSINGWTTEGESLTGVQISEEGLIQGTVCHSIGKHKHNYSLLSGRLCFIIQELIHIS
jgi:hypothetical protein